MKSINNALQFVRNCAGELIVGVVLVGAIGITVSDCAGSFDDKETAEKMLKAKGFEILEDQGHASMWTRPRGFGAATHKFKVVSRYNNSETSEVFVSGKKLSFTPISPK